jgi:hypothetical protein
LLISFIVNFVKDFLQQKITCFKIKRSKHWYIEDFFNANPCILKRKIVFFVNIRIAKNHLKELFGILKVKIENFIVSFINQLLLMTVGDIWFGPLFAMLALLSEDSDKELHLSLIINVESHQNCSENTLPLFFAINRCTVVLET